MPFILLYLIKLSVSLAVVFLFYHFILRKLTFYNHNRWYLLGYTLLAFLIPFINISPVLEKNNWDSRVVNWVPVITNNQAPAQGNESLFSTWEMLLMVFITGVIIMFIRLMLQLWSFRRMVQKATIISTEGMSIYQVDADIMPFSFGNAIFINRHLHREDELQEIISHEFVHVKQRHSLDIIWGELLCLFNWYNPFAWMLRKSIRQNLEFIADNKVLANGVDKKQYQYLLLKVIGNNQFSIAPKFNFSSLKKRIAMMNKLKSAKVQLVKFLFILPLVSVLLLAFRNKWNDRSPAPVEKKVSIAGLALDAQTRQPLPGVTIYCPEKQIQAVTDENGYYLLKLPYGVGPLQFSLVISKEGYHAMKQNENWGDFSMDAIREKYQYSYEFFTLSGKGGQNYGSTILAGNASSPEQLNLDGVREALEQVNFTNDDVWGISNDTIPKPPKVVRLPKDIEGISVVNTNEDEGASDPETQKMHGKVVVKRKDGKKEIYDMGSEESKAAFEKKYGVKLEEVVPPPPPPPPPPAYVPLPDNVQKININNDKVVVTLKNGQKENYDLNIAGQKAKFENKYGEIPPPPPAPPAYPNEFPASPPSYPGETPASPPAYNVPAPPPPPAVPKFPASVKGFSLDNNKAVITLKNGEKEYYDFSKPEEKAKFEKKYGEIVSPPPPPASANDLREIRVTGVTVSETRAGARTTTGVVTERPITTIAGSPLYVINGQPATTAEVNELPVKTIASVNVLKGESATALYGSKAKDGAVVIKTKDGSEFKVVEDPITSAGVTDKELSRTTVQNADLYRYGQKGLIILDGKEIPADVKKLNGSFHIVTLTKEEAIKKYGEKGKNGAIEMTTIKQ